MATLSAPVDIKSDKRRVSNDTLCSSNSSCVLQKRKQLHPLAGNIRYKNNSSSNVKQRVLSAKYLRFKTLQNELNDANFHIAQLISENKILKNLQKRQDHALAKYEGTDAEIPKMIESHQEEVRILQARNKNIRKNIKELNQQIRSKDEELNNLRDQNKHLMSLCKNKNLEERDKLTKKIEELEDLLRQRDNTISTLNRKIIVETKSCKFKLSTELNKNKMLQKELAQAQSQVEQLALLLEGKELNTERKIQRNTSTDRKKGILKLYSGHEREEKPSSSSKKSNGNNSSSETGSCDLNLAENTFNGNTQEYEHDSNDQKSPRSNHSSELQLKHVVNTLHKSKNVPDNVKESLSEYCMDVIDNVDMCSKKVDKRTLDFKNSEKEMESLLSALKESDEINKKFSKVSISPVLDFTDLFKNKDKNANVINKSTLQINDRTDNLDEFNEIKAHQTQADSDHTTDEEEIDLPKSYHPINLQSDRNDLDEMHFLRNNHKLESNKSSMSDLDEIIYDKSRRSHLSEVASEDKEKLLAKLKAIDNGENIEFSSVKKTKNDLIKELFG